MTSQGRGWWTEGVPKCLAKEGEGGLRGQLGQSVQARNIQSHLNRISLFTWDSMGIESNFIYWVCYFMSGCVGTAKNQTQSFPKVQLQMFSSLSHLKVIADLSVNGKLMRLGSPNRINDDLDFKAIYIDHRLTSIRIPTIKIESTIANQIQNRSIFNIN